MLNSEFKKKIIVLIEDYMKLKIPFNQLIKREERVSKNRAEFVLGYEMGSLEGEFANLFVMTFNRRMNLEEIKELRQMTNKVLLLFKRQMEYDTL